MHVGKLLFFAPIGFAALDAPPSTPHRLINALSGFLTREHERPMWICTARSQTLQTSLQPSTPHPSTPHRLLAKWSRLGGMSRFGWRAGWMDGPPSQPPSQVTERTTNLSWFLATAVLMDQEGRRELNRLRDGRYRTG